MKEKDKVPKSKSGWCDQFPSQSLALGLSPAEANGLLQQLLAKSGDKGDAIDFIMAAASEGLSAQNRREELAASMSQAEAEFQRSQAAVCQEEGRLARLQQACEQVNAQLTALREAQARAQQEAELMERHLREQTERLASAKSDVAATQNQHRILRLRNSLTLALSEFVTGPDERFDGQLAEALVDYLLARKLGHRHTLGGLAAPGAPHRRVAGTDAAPRRRGRRAEKAAAGPAPTVH